MAEIIISRNPRTDKKGRPLSWLIPKLTLVRAATLAGPGITRATNITKDDKIFLFIGYYYNVSDREIWNKGFYINNREQLNGISNIEASHQTVSRMSANRDRERSGVQ